ncbi:MAG: hypothetical protein AB7K64_21735 [Variibacter sp.]
MRPIVYRITPEEVGWSLRAANRALRRYGTRAEAFHAAAQAARRARRFGRFAWISVEGKAEGTTEALRKSA